MPARKRQSATKQPAPPQALAPATSLTYFQHTITPQDVARRYGRRVKPAELIRRYQSCPTVAYCVDTNAMVLAHFTPRIYKRGKAKSSISGVRQRRVTSARSLKCLRDENRVGDAAIHCKDAGDDVFEVTDHPFLNLYARPNPRETRINYWGAEWALRQVTGNCYAMVVKGDDGLPAELWHCYPQYMTPTLSKDEFIDGFRYWVPGDQPITFAPEDVVHTIWMQSGFLTWDGKGWVETVVADIDSLITINAQEQASYENNCQPCGVMTMHEDLGPDQVKQQEASVNKKHQGPQNVGKILVVQGATSFTPLGWSPREMQSGATVSAHERRIRNAANIPESFANLSQSNLAGAISGDSQYSSLAIQPQLVNHAEMLTKFMLEQYGHNEGDYWLSYDNIVETNIDEIRDNAAKMYQAGVWTLNRALAECGDDPIEDERGGLLFMENAARAQSTFGPTNQMYGDLGSTANAPKTESVGQAPTRFLPAPGKVDAPAADAGKSVSLPVVETVKPVTKDADPDTIQTTPPPPDLLSAVRGWLEESQASGKYDPDALATAIADPIRDIFQAGGVAGLNDLAEHGIDISGLPGVAENGVAASFNVLPQAALDALNGYTIRLAQSIAADKEVQLREAIAAGLREGMNTQDTTAAVMQSLGDRTQDQADMIARTETTRAYVEGTRAAWHSVGVEGKQILLAPGACDICKAVQAQFPGPIPLHQPYFKNGESIAYGAGKSFTFNYGDVQGPPFHPGDRCSLRPVQEIQQ